MRVGIYGGEGAVLLPLLLFVAAAVAVCCCCLLMLLKLLSSTKEARPNREKGNAWSPCSAASLTCLQSSFFCRTRFPGLPLLFLCFVVECSDMRTRANVYPKYILLLSHDPPLPLEAESISRASVKSLLHGTVAAAVPSELDPIVDELVDLSEQSRGAVCCIMRDDITNGIFSNAQKKLGVNGATGDFFDPQGAPSMQLSIVCRFLKNEVFPQLVPCEGDVPDWFNAVSSRLYPRLPRDCAYCHYLIGTLVSARNWGVEHISKKPIRPTLYVDLAISTDYMERLCHHKQSTHANSQTYPSSLKRMYADMWSKNKFEVC